MFKEKWWGAESVQLLSRVRLFATPWTAAHQASLSITNSQRLLKLMSIESVMPSNHLILCYTFLLLPSIFPSIRIFSSGSRIHLLKCAPLTGWCFKLKAVKTQQTQEKLLASPLTAQNNVDYTAYARKRAITGENFNFRKIYPPGGANIYSSGTCSSHPPLGCLPPPWSPTPFSLAQGSV